MSRLIVDELQASLLAKSHGRVEIRDRTGILLGYFTPVCPEEEIAEARRALAQGGPRYTTEQVLRHLESLRHK